MRKGRDGEKKNGKKKRKKNGGKKEENTDENSGHYVIASSQPPERRPLERRTLVPKRRQTEEFDLLMYRNAGVAHQNSRNIQLCLILDFVCFKYLPKVCGFYSI